MLHQVIGMQDAAVVKCDVGALFAQAFVQAGIGAWTCDLADNTLAWTPGVYDIFGLAETDRLDRRDIVALYDDQSREIMERLRADAIMHGRPFEMEAQIVRPDGERRWMRLRADVVRENGRHSRLFGLKQDITDEKQRWDALRSLAERDPLTGLANRARYEELFLNGSRAQPGVTPLGALLLIDLDNFKQINDQFGHAAGDACLKMVGQRLASAFADAPLVARIGGDEFAVLSHADTSPPALKSQVARLLASLARPIAWQGQTLVLGASAGIGFAPDPYCYDADDLFAIADKALYAAKGAGRNAIIVGNAQIRAFPHDFGLEIGARHGIRS